MCLKSHPLTAVLILFAQHYFPAPSQLCRVNYLKMLPTLLLPHSAKLKTRVNSGSSSILLLLLFNTTSVLDASYHSGAYQWKLSGVTCSLMPITTQGSASHCPHSRGLPLFQRKRWKPSGNLDKSFSDSSRKKWWVSTPLSHLYQVSARCYNWDSQAQHVSPT